MYSSASRLHLQHGGAGNPVYPGYHGDPRDTRVSAVQGEQARPPRCYCYHRCCSHRLYQHHSPVSLRVLVVVVVVVVVEVSVRVVVEVSLRVVVVVEVSYISSLSSHSINNIYIYVSGLQY